MQNEIRKHAWAIVIGACLVAFMFQVASLADQLEPPGPPAPTSPIQIRASDLPLNIVTSGSYQLAESINTGGGGITISASNVTIDLMGLTLEGGSGDGIFADNATSNIVVKNGTLRNWSSDGVDLSGSVNCQVLDIRAEGNGTGFTADGIRIGAGGRVAGCTSMSNSGDGIDSGSQGIGVSITNSTASFNTGAGIMLTQGGSSVTNCAVHGNTSTGIGGTGNGITVTNCAARDNNGDGIALTGAGAVIVHCVAYSNGNSAGDDGIAVGAGSTVTECTANSNFEDGIEASSGSRIFSNTSRSNSGNGINITGSDNRIEGNNVTVNSLDGINVNPAVGNFIIRNSASGNSVLQYDLAGGNVWGTVSVLGAGAFSNTNSFANFEY